MTVINTLDIFLRNNPEYEVVTSCSSYYPHHVLEFQAQKLHDCQAVCSSDTVQYHKVSLIGRDTKNLHCCWILKYKSNLMLVK